MKQLFMIGIGGKTEYSNIEVHDLRFLAVENIEASHDLLKESWFGKSDKLHMDSYTILEGLDQYKITLKDHPSDKTLSLFMINFGGYKKEDFFEWHDLCFVVASDDKAARKIALENKPNGIQMLHVDQIVDVNEVLQGDAFIHLEAVETHYDLKPTWQGYTKIK